MLQRFQLVQMVSCFPGAAMTMDSWAWVRWTGATPRHGSRVYTGSPCSSWRVAAPTASSSPSLARSSPGAETGTPTFSLTLLWNRKFLWWSNFCVMFTQWRLYANSIPPWNLTYRVYYDNLKQSKKIQWWMHKYNTAQFSRYIVLHLRRICPLQNFTVLFYKKICRYVLDIQN